MLKNILRLMLGNGIAQFIQLASIPLLTQFYSPKQFGILAIVIAISGVLAVISSLQLNVAIVTLKNTIAVERLLSSALLLNLIMTVVSLLLTFMISYIFYDENISAQLVFIIVAITFFSSMNNTLKGVFVNFGSFFSLSKTFLFRAVVIVSLQFIFAFLSIVHGLILGVLFGEVIMFIIILFAQLKISIDIKFTRRSYLKLFVLLKKLKAFVVYGTAQELVSVVIFWLPLFIIVAFFGSDIGGQYSISARILWPATVLVSSSIANVLFHYMVKKYQSNLSGELFFSHYLKLLYILLLLVAYFLTPVIFDYIVDETWDVAVDLSKYVALLCVVFLYALPYRVVFRVFKLQKKQLKIEVLVSIVLIMNFMLLSFDDISSVIIWVIFAMSAQALILEFFARRVLISNE